MDTNVLDWLEVTAAACPNRKRARRGGAGTLRSFPPHFSRHAY